MKKKKLIKKLLMFIILNKKNLKKKFNIKNKFHVILEYKFKIIISKKMYIIKIFYHLMNLIKIKKNLKMKVLNLVLKIFNNYHLFQSQNHL